MASQGSQESSGPVDRLSDEQRQAVEAPVAGSKLVLACAGSGKTRVMVARIVRFIRVHGCAPSSIFALTFTNNAAALLSARIDAALALIDPKAGCPGPSDGDGDEKVVCGTFHSVAQAILRASGVLLPTRIYQVDELQYMLRDFLYSDHPAAAGLLQHVKHVFVDEYQDVNDCQYEIVRKLTETAGLQASVANANAVGDDDQNIFQFRGSSVRFILQFSVHFPGATTYHLTENFRSTPQIVALANACISRNTTSLPKPPAFSRQRPGPLPRLLEHGSPFASAAAVCADIAALVLPGDRQEPRTRPKDVAVLCRNGYLLNHVQAGLCKLGVRSVFFSGDDQHSRDRRSSSECDDCVVLSTVHGSKGLEWLHVYIIGLSNSHFPSSREPDLEQERRLYYVAVTRCQRYLTLCSSIWEPSVFVYEVPQHLMLRSRAHGSLGPGPADQEHRRCSVLDRLHAELRDRVKAFADAAASSQQPLGRVGVLATVRGLQGEDYYSELRRIVDVERFEDQLRTPRRPGNGSAPDGGSAAQPPHRYAPWITSNFLQAEFGTFLDFLLRRMVAEITGAASCHDRYAEACLGADPKSEGAGSCHSWKQLPASKRFQLRQAYERYRACAAAPWRECLEATWLASAFQSLHNSRVYVLYVNVAPLWLEAYSGMYEGMHAFLRGALRPHEGPAPPFVRTGWQVSHGRLSGEVDLVARDLVVDFKNSQFDVGRCQLDHFLQVLAYASILRLEHAERPAETPQVTRVGLYNPMGNVYHEVDISDWHGERELVDFLLRKGKSPIG